MAPIPRPGDALAARLRRQEDDLRALTRRCNEQDRRLAELEARAAALEEEEREGP